MTNSIISVVDLTNNGKKSSFEIAIQRTNRRRRITKGSEKNDNGEGDDYLGLYDLRRRRKEIGDGGFYRDSKETTTTRSLSERHCNNNNNNKILYNFDEYNYIIEEMYKRI
ncbi:unnamed protein product [Cochlearia groenlandica]